MTMVTLAFGYNKVLLAPLSQYFRAGVTCSGSRNPGPDFRYELSIKHGDL